MQCNVLYCTIIMRSLLHNEGTLDLLQYNCSVFSELGGSEIQVRVLIANVRQGQNPGSGEPRLGPAQSLAWA